MTTHYTNQPTGQQHHQGVPQRGAANNTVSIIAIVLGVIGFLFLPIVFALAGVVLGIIAKTVRHERLSTVAIVVSAVGLVGGMILGAVLASM
ncbi:MULTISPECIES: hypothetical protein [Streptomyces]|uniref:DUF4190 domain-containing protein n=1 Tax=Streptomyces rhizosphaericola TaxID=2564098 RepID=A0ABY2PJN2_9ACTN|nr:MULTISPECIES: hypothetical protein [Streptomyces]ARI54671.1 hypothetical protein A6E92_22705 [Streptomyces sp. S8]MYT93900.1 hypothetical protein [Streptomyces sp. SID8359]MYU00487.1 hypothetical protein [Streptomyces sp. SID8350]NGO84433.1 hypothetical protein [Streptomyces sp. 196(2019)]PWS40061.1 hypothetical protein DKT74_35025 [Streptomyces sp. ZEA17I]